MRHNARTAAAVTALTAAVAVPALSRADPSTTTHDITVREKLRGAVFVQQDTSTGKDKLARETAC
jgi:hypothetical protein